MNQNQSMKLLRISEILKDKEISNKHLAAEMKVSENTISKIVTGKTFPRADLLLNMANFLDVDIRDLFEPTKPEGSTGDSQDLYIRKGERYIKVGEINLG